MQKWVHWLHRTCWHHWLIDVVAAAVVVLVVIAVDWPRTCVGTPAAVVVVVVH